MAIDAEVADNVVDTTEDSLLSFLLCTKQNWETVHPMRLEKIFLNFIESRDI